MGVRTCSLETSHLIIGKLKYSKTQTCPYSVCTFCEVYRKSVQKSAGS